jgi:hypothetical protein
MQMNEISVTVTSTSPSKHGFRRCGDLEVAKKMMRAVFPRFDGEMELEYAKHRAEGMVVVQRQAAIVWTVAWVIFVFLIWMPGARYAVKGPNSMWVANAIFDIIRTFVFMVVVQWSCWAAFRYAPKLMERRTDLIYTAIGLCSALLFSITPDRFFVLARTTWASEMAQVHSFIENGECRGYPGGCVDFDDPNDPCHRQPECHFRNYELVVVAPLMMTMICARPLFFPTPAHPLAAPARAFSTPVPSIPH